MALWAQWGSHDGKAVVREMANNSAEKVCFPAIQEHEKAQKRNRIRSSITVNTKKLDLEQIRLLFPAGKLRVLQIGSTGLREYKVGVSRFTFYIT